MYTSNWLYLLSKKYFVGDPGLSLYTESRKTHYSQFRDTVCRTENCLQLKSQSTTLLPGHHVAAPNVRNMYIGYVGVTDEIV